MKKRLTVVLSIVLALVLVAGGYAIGAKKGITVNINYQDAGLPESQTTSLVQASQATTAMTQPATQPSSDITDVIASVPNSSNTSDTSAPASSESSAPNASALPSTTADIVARYNEVVNKAKAATGVVSIHKVENIDVKVDDCSASAAKSIVNSIVQKFLASTDETLNFENGSATNDKGETKALNEYVPPKAKNAALDAAGVKEASCVDNGDGTYVLNITLNEEKASFDGGVAVDPTYHQQVMEPLNLATLDVSPAKITKAGMTYPGLIIKATVTTTGELKELYHSSAMVGTGTGEVKVITTISLDVTLSGNITDTWTFTW